MARSPICQPQGCVTKQHTEHGGWWVQRQGIPHPHQWGATTGLTISHYISVTERGKKPKSRNRPGAEPQIQPFPTRRPCSHRAVGQLWTLCPLLAVSINSWETWSWWRLQLEVQGAKQMRERRKPLSKEQGWRERNTESALQSAHHMYEWQDTEYINRILKIYIKMNAKHNPQWANSKVWDKMD